MRPRAQVALPPSRSRTFTPSPFHQGTLLVALERARVRRHGSPRSRAARTAAQVRHALGAPLPPRDPATGRFRAARRAVSPEVSP